jgi:hypothetical protein
LHPAQGQQDLLGDSHAKLAFALSVSTQATSSLPYLRAGEPALQPRQKLEVNVALPTKLLLIPHSSLNALL